MSRSGAGDSSRAVAGQGAVRGVKSGEALLQLSVKRKQGVQSQWTETGADQEGALSPSQCREN